VDALLADEESLHLTHLVQVHQPALAILRWALELWAVTPEGGSGPGCGSRSP
jgi:hypothetical protein